MSRRERRNGLHPRAGSVLPWVTVFLAVIWAARRTPNGTRGVSHVPLPGPEPGPARKRAKAEPVSVLALFVSLVALAITAMTIPGSPVHLGTLMGGDSASPDDLVIRVVEYDAERVDGVAAYLLPARADVRFPDSLYRRDLDGYCDRDARAGIGAIGLMANPYVSFNLTNTHISSETSALHLTALRFRVTEVLDVEPSVAFICPTGGDSTDVISARITTDGPRVGDDFAIHSYLESAAWDELGELDRAAGPPSYTVSPGETVTFVVGVKSLSAGVRGHIVATVTNGKGQPQEVILTDGFGAIGAGALDAARTVVNGGGRGELYCTDRSEYGTEGQAQPCVPRSGSTVMEPTEE